MAMSDDEPLGGGMFFLKHLKFSSTQNDGLRVLGGGILQCEREVSEMIIL